MWTSLRAGRSFLRPSQEPSRNLAFPCAAASGFCTGLSVTAKETTPGTSLSAPRLPRTTTRSSNGVSNSSLKRSAVKSGVSTKPDCNKPNACEPYSKLKSSPPLPYATPMNGPRNTQKFGLVLLRTHFGANTNRYRITVHIASMRRVCVEILGGVHF